MKSICECLEESPVSGYCEEFGKEFRNEYNDTYGTMPLWQTKEIENMARDFDYERLIATKEDGGCGLDETAGIMNVDLKYWDVSGVTDMTYMLRGMPSFQGDGLKFWET